jgi:aspartyl-tRNA(Asn)/glutamyl-tRNA(Gln) amidotransferase subunit B
MGPLLGLANARGLGLDALPVSPPALAGLLKLVDSGAISAKSAKDVFDEMAASGKDAAEIVAEKGLAQISDSGALDKLVGEVLEKNPKEVDAFRRGKTKLMGFFVGEVMKATRGQANPKAVNELLRKKLGA